VICTVANFRDQKDYPNLLRAARELADRGLDFRLVAVGQGPLENETRDLVRQLDLGDRVILTGFRPDAVRVMTAADVFTLASKWEGLPVAVMEACALGLPIVATAVGGVREQLRGEVDALLVPPGDHVALADALWGTAGDKDRRARLAAASIVRALDFDVSRARREVEATYARLVPPAVQLRPATDVSVPRLISGLDVRPASPEDRPAILDLLSRALGWGDDPRFAELFAWKHEQGAFGPSPMWVATHGGQVVGLRAFMRWEFVRGGQVLKAVRAVDTATDPDYQGRGLFTALTMHGLEALREEGVDFVFNTPNEQSRPGYLKMGWREVGRLRAAVAPARATSLGRILAARMPSERWSEELPVGTNADIGLEGLIETGVQSPPAREITTNRSSDYLRWRYGFAALRYRVIPDGTGAVVGRLRLRGAAREFVILDRFGIDPARADRVALRAAREAGADYVIRLGSSSVGAGYVPLMFHGPMLTWRAVSSSGMPPIANWNLSMGDVELF
jgi:predicted N-acetyltransferase YhbS